MSNDKINTESENLETAHDKGVNSTDLLDKKLSNACTVFFCVFFGSLAYALLFVRADQPLLFFFCMFSMVISYLIFEIYCSYKLKSESDDNKGHS